MLESLYERGIIYDWENYKNCHVCTMYSLRTKQYKTFVMYKNRDDRKEFLDIVNSKVNGKPRVLIGYYNNDYDNAITEHLIKYPNISLFDLWKFGQSLIKERKNPYKYRSKLESIDLNEIIRAGYGTIPLKGALVNLKFDRIQDLPINPEEEINDSNLENLISYNKDGDVRGTILLFEHLKDRLAMRETITEEFGVKVNGLADSAIGKQILDKLYYEKLKETNPDIDFNEFKKLRTHRGDIPIKDIIYDQIQFKTEELSNFLTTLKSLTIKLIQEKKKKEVEEDSHVCEDIPPLIFNGIEYSVALGGIHSVDKPLIIIPTEDEMLLDLDVTSQYPSRIIADRICPAHLDPDIFIPLFESILDKRKYYKSNSKTNPAFTALADGMKLSANSIFGSFNFSNYFLYDPICTYQTTLRNQLWLLMLIEDITLAGYKLISANTDGILLHIQKSELENVRKIYKEWEIKSSFQLEETVFTKYFRSNISNYLAEVKEWDKEKQEYKYKRKLKGALFVPQGGILKSFAFPVIAMALQEYYMNGIDPEEYLYAHKDIYNFCFSQKIGRQFKPYLYQINRSIIDCDEKGKPYKEPRNIDTIISQTEVQKTLRFYVSRPTIDDNGVMSGNILKKVKREIKPVKTLIKEKVVIPAEYIEEQRINPDTGRLKKYKEKVRDKQIIPAEYQMVEQEVISESVLASGQFITMFNNYVEYTDFSDYNISYDYYLGKIWGEISKIGLIK